MASITCVPQDVWKKVMAKTKSLRQPSEGLTQILAENIRAYRSVHGLSQEDFADKCGLHRTYVGSVERCERNVTLSTLEVFATVLGIPVPELLMKKSPKHGR
jgi:ribosome-binding protein aMBF1 (putative translation factor)